MRRWMSNPMLSPDAPGGAAPGAATGGPGGNAAQPGTGGASAGGQPAVPAGMRLVPESDWAARDRAYGHYQKLGFKDDAEVDVFGRVISTIRDRKIDPAVFVNAFGGQQDRGAAADAAKGPLTQADLDRVLEEKLTAKERERLEKEHGEYVAGLGALRGEILSEVLGADEGKRDKLHTKIIPAIVDQALSEERVKNAYPDGHPLAGRAGRLGADFKARVVASAKAVIDEIKAAQMGAVARAASAGAAGSGPRGTVGGSAGGQGAPETPKPNGRVPREAIADSVRRARAALGVQ